MGREGALCPACCRMQKMNISSFMQEIEAPIYILIKWSQSTFSPQVKAECWNTDADNDADLSGTTSSVSDVL